jgi:hypothetical protein
MNRLILGVIFLLCVLKVPVSATIQVPQDHIMGGVSYLVAEDQRIEAGYYTAYGITPFFEMGLSGAYATKEQSFGKVRRSSYSLFANFVYNLVIADLKAGRSYTTSQSTDPANTYNTVYDTGGTTSVALYFSPRSTTRPFLLQTWTDTFADGKTQYDSGTYVGLRQGLANWELSGVVSTNFARTGFSLEYFF